MSSAVFSTSAAPGRHFFLDDESTSLQDSCGDSRPRLSGRAKLDGAAAAATKILPSSVTPASQLAIRPAPEMASSGIPAIDSLTGGLPRGCLTEIFGPASSGRATLLLAALSAATRRGEFCALVDASDALDPQSAAAAGIELDRLLWVRCEESIPKKRTRDMQKERAASRGTHPSEHCLEQVLRATDLLLESGGFGLIVLDLADLPPQSARRIPLTTWFRFRRAVEHKPTILLAIEQQPIAGSCSSLLLKLGATDEAAAKRRKSKAHGASRGFDAGEVEVLEGPKNNRVSDPRMLEAAHTNLFTGLNIHAELIHSRIERKPARSVVFATKTAWAG